MKQFFYKVLNKLGFKFDETKYLTSSKKNKERLEESIQQLNTSDLQPRELLD